MEPDYISNVKDLHRQILKKQTILHCLNKRLGSTQFENRVKERLLVQKFPNINLILNSTHDGDVLDEKDLYDIVCREMASFNNWVMEINDSQGHLNVNNFTSELTQFKDKTKSISKALTSYNITKEESSRLIHACKNQTVELMEKKASSLTSTQCKNLNVEPSEDSVSEEMTFKAMEKLIHEENQLKSELQHFKVHGEEYERILKDYTQILKEIS